jgi:hypothetical protein
MLYNDQHQRAIIARGHAGSQWLTQHYWFTLQPKLPHMLLDKLAGFVNWAVPLFVRSGYSVLKMGRGASSEEAESVCCKRPQLHTMQSCASR